MFLLLLNYEDLYAVIYKCKLLASYICVVNPIS